MGIKYVSIDIETSGIDPNKDEILSVGLAIEDTNNILPLEEIPQIEFIITRDRIEGGNIFALNMNKRLIEKINNYNLSKNKSKFQTEHDCVFVPLDVLAVAVRDFLEDNGLDCREKINVAGKNFAGFDNLFLQQVPGWNKFIKTHQRVIDPATSFVDWQLDTNLPNLSGCKERAGLDVLEVTHESLKDALDIIKVLRKLYD